MATQSIPPFGLPAIGLELQVRLSRESSFDGFTVIEARSAPGSGPPLHRRAEMQICYVLAGSYHYEIEGARFTARTGDALEVPADAAHAFLNISDKPARQLMLMQPGFNTACFLDELRLLLAPELTDPQALWRFERNWGIELLGPPLSPPSARGPNRRHTPEFRLALCRDIRNGTLGRREARKKYSLSDNLIHLWLARYDRDERTATTS